MPLFPLHYLNYLKCVWKLSLIYQFYHRKTEPSNVPTEVKSILATDSQLFKESKSNSTTIFLENDGNNSSSKSSKSNNNRNNNSSSSISNLGGNDDLYQTSETSVAHSEASLPRLDRFSPYTPVSANDFRPEDLQISSVSPQKARKSVRFDILDGNNPHIGSSVHTASSSGKGLGYDDDVVGTTNLDFTSPSVNSIKMLATR